MRGCGSLGGVTQVTEDVAGLQQVGLGGMVIAGFDCGLALLLELAGFVELLALGGIGGAAVAHVRELERHLPFRLDQVGRRERRSPGGLEGKCHTAAIAAGSSVGVFIEMEL